MLWKLRLFSLDLVRLRWAFHMPSEQGQLASAQEGSPTFPTSITQTQKWEKEPPCPWQRAWETSLWPCIYISMNLQIPLLYNFYAMKDLTCSRVSYSSACSGTEPPHGTSPQSSLFTCQNVTYPALPSRCVGNVWLWGWVLGHQASTRVQVHFCSHCSDFEKHEAFAWIHIYKYSHKNIHSWIYMPSFILGICRVELL